MLVILQNNDARSLTIIGANDTATNLLGYAGGDLNGQPLLKVLGNRTVKLLNDELEYGEDTPDLGEILTRQRTIRLRNRLNEELDLNCKVSRLMVEDKHARFQLIIPDEREHRLQQQLKNFLKLNFEGRKQLDPATGLPDRATTETYLDLLQSYLASNQMQAVFAVVRIDRFEKSLARYGKDGCAQLLQHVANCCRSTLRTEDVISALSDQALGLILFDISRESVRLVLNRLRWNVGNYRIEFGGKADFSVTVSIAFDMLGGNRNETAIVRGEEAVAALDADTRNGLIELGA